MQPAESSGEQIAELGVQPPELGVQPPELGVQLPELGVQPPELGVQPPELGAPPAKVHTISDGANHVRNFGFVAAMQETFGIQVLYHIELSTVALSPVKFFSKLNNLFSGCFDPENILLDTKNK